MKANKKTVAKSGKAAVSNVAAVATNAAQSATVAGNATVETVKAITIALDCANQHRLRIKAQSAGVDLMVTHATKKSSAGYIATCLAFRSKLSEKDATNTDRDAVVIVNGVSRTVRSLADGFYVSANDGVCVVGNVDLLTQLYGKAVKTLAISSLASLWNDGAKVTLKKGKRTFDGAVILAERDNGSGDCSFVVKDGARFYVHNGEYGRNAHNGSERVATIKVNADKGASEAQKEAEKLASKG